MSALFCMLVVAGSRGEKVLFQYPFKDLGPRACSTLGTKSSTRSTPRCDDYVEPSFLGGDILASVLSPKPSLCNQGFEMKIDDLFYVGYPTLLSDEDTSLPSRLGVVPEYERVVRLLNIVFVLPATASRSVRDQHISVSCRLAIAIFREEKRDLFLSKERAHMVDVLDRFYARTETPDVSAVYQNILEVSLLAQHIKHVYESLARRGSVFLWINNSVHLSGCLHSVVHRLQSGIDVDTDQMSRCISLLRPYHGLLLLRDERDLIEELPRDCSEPLRRLICRADPCKNLLDLSEDLCVGFSYLNQLVIHLINWGNAMPIYPLSEANVYVATDGSKLRPADDILNDFKSRFPKLDFYSLIGTFSCQTSLGELVNLFKHEGVRSEVQQAVVWMLRRRYIKQLHCFLYASSITSDRTDIPRADDVTHSLSSVEGVEEEDIANFSSYQKYFNGRHHVEDIMFDTNVKRSELVKLVEKFRSVLFTFELTDPCVGLFYGR